VLCLVLAYVLSFGPVAGLAARGHLGHSPHRNIVRAYAPPFWILDNREDVATAFDLYVRLFVPKPPQGALSEQQAALASH
jgi:hypothetical protein